MTADLGALSRRRGVAYYHQVYTLLANALATGIITGGSALPSETELMNHWGVSRNTVRRALGQLEAEKRIVRRRGSGSYARSLPSTVLTPDMAAEVIQDGAAARLHTSSRLLRIQNGRTPAYIRQRDPQFEDSGMLVLRCRNYKDTPFMLTTSFVPETLARRLTRRLLSQQTVLAALDAIGVAPATAEQTMTAVTADTAAARYLGVEPDAALLCVHRLVKDGAGRSIEHQSHVYRPDRCQMHTRMSVKRAAEGLTWVDSRSPPIPAWL